MGSGAAMSAHRAQEDSSACDSVTLCSSIRIGPQDPFDVDDLGCVRPVPTREDLPDRRVLRDTETRPFAW